MLGRLLKTIDTYSVNTVGLLAVLVGTGYIVAGLAGALPAGATGAETDATQNALTAALPSSGTVGFLAAHVGYLVLAVVGLAAMARGHEFA